MIPTRISGGLGLALPRVVSLIVALVLLVSGTVVRAEVSGQTDQRFQAALSDWLANNDQAALPAFAALARTDNRAAQILLALIDMTPAIQGPWLEALPRAERIALMRAPGGLSGRSWMRVAAEDTPLAQLWLLRLDVGQTAEAETALAFAEIGEARAARQTLLAMGARQRRGFAEIAADPLYPSELRYLVWREWASDPVLVAKVGTEMSSMLPGDPQLGLHDGRPAFIAEQDDWLARAPLAEPLRGFCDATCPESPRSCARAAFEMVGGNDMGVFVVGTPSETLVPPDMWNTSPRGLKAMMRQPYTRDVSQTRSLLTATVERIESIDRCVGAALADETETAR